MTKESKGRVPVKLADPTAGPLQVLADGGLDVTMRVTKNEFEWGWAKVGGIMDAEPSGRRNDWTTDGHSEQELRLLCGLFCAVTNALPMASYNYVDWLIALSGGPDDLDGYVSYRLGQMSDDQLSEMLNQALRGRSLDALGLERLDDPVQPNRCGGKRRRANGSAQQSN